jgi:plastocyanin
MRSSIRFMAAVLFMAAGTAAFAAGDPAKFTIHIRDYIFRPGVLHVHPGDTVTYINDDDDAHTVTADDKSFDSKGIDSKAQWTHVFAKPGKFT